MRVDFDSIVSHIREAPIDLVGLLWLYVFVSVCGSWLHALHIGDSAADIVAVILGGYAAIFFFWWWKPALLEALQARNVGRWLRPGISQILFDSTQPLSLALLAVNAALWVAVSRNQVPSAWAAVSVLGAVVALGAAGTVSFGFGRGEPMANIASRLRAIVFLACLGMIGSVSLGWSGALTYLASIGASLWVIGALNYAAVRVMQRRVMYLSLDRDFGHRPAGFPFWWLARIGLVPLAWPLFNFSATVLRLRRSTREVVKGRVMLLSRRYDFERIEREARRYNARFDPTDPQFSVTLAYYEAMALIRRAEPREALDRLEPAIRALPQAMPLRVARGRAYWAMGNLTAALDGMHAALREFRDTHERPCYVGEEFKALVTCEQALVNDPIDLGAIERVGRDLEALPDKAVQLNPSIYVVKANVRMLSATIGLSPNLVGEYRAARQLLTGQIARSRHPGAQMRLSLLQMIGTKDYSEALHRLQWLLETLSYFGYARRHAYVLLVEGMVSVAETAQRDRMILTPRIVIEQTPFFISDVLERCRARGDGDRWEELRRRVFPTTLWWPLRT